MSDLTLKQEAFVHAYIKNCGNASEAYRQAYDAEAMKDSTIWRKAKELLDNGKVAARITAERQKIQARHDVTMDRVIQELAKIGFSNMLDYVRTTDDGDAFVNLSALTREQAAAISEITVEDFLDGRGEDARQVRKTKFKLSDKRAALVDLGKHLGMFVEKHEHTGKDGKDLLPETSPRDLARAVLDVLRKAKTQDQP